MEPPTTGPLERRMVWLCKTCGKRVDPAIVAIGRARISVGNITITCTNRHTHTYQQTEGFTIERPAE